jgi:hypothetical protein
MTLATTQSFIASPAGLFILMLLASIANGAKQLAVVSQTSVPMTCMQYWSHVPETLAMLAGNTVAFVILLMTSQLNYASAIAVGYGLNSLADLIPRGRSYALKSAPDDPLKQQQEKPK